VSEVSAVSEVSSVSPESAKAAGLPIRKKMSQKEFKGPPINTPYPTTIGGRQHIFRINALALRKEEAS
jgi:hypothetical protein